MNTNERTQTKILATVLTAVGAACWGLAGLAVNKLLQSGQSLPVWAVVLLIIGAILFLTAVLILVVPPSNWKRSWYSVKGIPRWLRETCIWKRCAPTCTLEVSRANCELTNDEQTRNYTAKVSLSICVSPKSMPYWPIKVVLWSRAYHEAIGEYTEGISLHLEQNRGLTKVSADLGVDRYSGIPKEILIKSPGQTSPYETTLTSSSYNNPNIAFVDTQKGYRWQIKGIEVHLFNVQMYRKLSERGRVADAEKSE